ncbi:MAG: hypothetical protein H7125_07505, partial [Proteobacteria bacterium]|nr:hypothetical protein [Burkholderiales bacterium]
SASPARGAAAPNTDAAAAKGAADVGKDGRTPAYPGVRRGVPLEFPRDFGAHPEFRTEWWYITGWLDMQAGTPFGFQITFFRSRPRIDPRNPSRFAAHQLVLAHLALSDDTRRSLVHDQRSARAGFDLAGARVGDTDVWIDDWRLVRTGNARASRYQAVLAGNRLALELELVATQPLLLHGEAGYSRKGVRPEQASYYYTEPHLAVTGKVVHEARAHAVKGSAWLDHEWSSEILAADAVGWDWIGINLDDGGTLMAFRIRNRDGATVWAGGTRRAPDGTLQVFDPRAIVFTPLREWRSARTGARYPVAMRITFDPDLTAAGATRAETIELLPLFDDQELDARIGTGIVYWEGAVTASREGRRVGRGYLELTGYHGAVSV